MLVAFTVTAGCDGRVARFAAASCADAPITYVITSHFENSRNAVESTRSNSRVKTHAIAIRIARPLLDVNSRTMPVFWSIITPPHRKGTANRSRFYWRFQLGDPSPL